MDRLGRPNRRVGRSLACLAALIVAALVPGPAFTDADAGDRSADTRAPEEEESAARNDEDGEETHLASRREPPPVYRPPRRGAPRAKVGAGLRVARARARPTALAPDHVGHTVAASPSLFWHIDAMPALEARLVFTLIAEMAIEPLVEREIARPAAPGIQRIRLSELGVSLEPEVEYQWSVALVPDADHRSRDVVGLGFIRRVPAPDELALRRPGVETLAGLGLWYDALESVSDAIEARPRDPVLRSQRVALLEQAGLEGGLLLVGARESPDGGG